MIAYNIHNANPVQRQESPLEPGVWLMPGNCTDVVPPEFNKETHVCKFDGAQWVVELKPQNEDEDISVPSNITAMDQLRHQRDSKLAQSDWRMTVDYPYADQNDWELYRTELRELPQEIAANNVPQPTLDENNMLVFNHWPEEPNA
jgi:hypothetical protein